MTVIIAGGAGFIGSNFVHFQLKNHKADRIVCVDKLTYAGNTDNLREAFSYPNFRFVKLDICDEASVEKVFAEEKPDIVVNFAAESHVDRSIADVSVFLQTNVIGTQVLMDVSRKCGVKRYHQVSTDEVYGALPLNESDKLFTETTPIAPSSPYSASKASADLLVGAYCKTYGFPATISRCSNNYGPRQFPEKLIPLSIAHLLQGKAVPVYGAGLNVRDWIYVEDHCRALDLIIRHGRVGETYNIGGACEKRNIDVVKRICKELKKSEEKIVYVEDRKGHDLRYGIDNTKIEKELGWKPQTDFETGIALTVAWYVENTAFWKRILSGENKNM